MEFTLSLKLNPFDPCFIINPGCKKIWFWLSPQILSMSQVYRDTFHAKPTKKNVHKYIIDKKSLCISKS